MKTLLIVALLGAGVWYLLVRAKRDAEVKRITESPLQYTKALQGDEDRAKTAVDAANKAIVSENEEARKVEAAQ